jgi:hypothetical protein
MITLARFLSLPMSSASCCCALCRVAGLSHRIDRYLGPHQQTELVGQTRHVAVVGIVREPNEVGAELLRPAEQGAGVRFAPGASQPQRRLLVDRDPAQEYGLTVEQYVQALDLDGAKADPVANVVGLGSNLYPVQPGTAGRPALELGREAELGVAVLVGADRGLSADFRDLDCHLLLGLGTAELQPAGHLAARAPCQLDEVVAYEGSRARPPASRLA